MFGASGLAAVRANLGRRTQQCEPDLQTFHGHLVDLGRPSTCTGANCTFAPTDRYEPWLRAPDGTERKFTVHTREMPARHGHDVSLITTHRRPRVLALANWTTIDGVNCACSEPRGLVRASDVPRLAAGSSA